MEISKKGDQDIWGKQEILENNFSGDPQNK